MKTNEKLYDKDGRVAVAVSPGYGAGWSTWNDVSATDGRYNKLILEKQWDKAIELAEKEGHYTGGLSDCRIEWLEEGSAYRVDEYDGSELLVTYNDFLTV